MMQQRSMRSIRHTLLLLIALGLVIMQPAQAHEPERLDRGYLTSTDTLESIRRHAITGNQPYTDVVAIFLERVGDTQEWEHGEAMGEFIFNDDNCRMVDKPGEDRFINQQGGAHAVYQKMLAYHITHDIDYARVARTKILELVTTYGFGGDVYSGANECIRHLAFAVPLWIQAADLLEDTFIWTDEDRRVFSEWLVREVYHKVAWASYARRNNWGVAGSLTASMIADYVSEEDLILTEQEPAARQISAADAYAIHNQQQQRRMRTSWQGDSRCDIWGIRPYGGIPDELRRGRSGCDGQWLFARDDSWVYQISHIDFLIFHAEYLRLRGDTSLYDNMQADGSGSLLQAIHFIIENPTGSEYSQPWEAYKIGILHVAFSYYENVSIMREIVALDHESSVERGGVTAFAQLTHIVHLSDNSSP